MIFPAKARNRVDFFSLHECSLFKVNFHLTATKTVGLVEEVLVAYTKKSCGIPTNNAVLFIKGTDMNIDALELNYPGTFIITFDSVQIAVQMFP